MERRDVLRDRADNSGDVENDVGVQRRQENVERRQENDENNENNEDGWMSSVKKFHSLLPSVN